MLILLRLSVDSITDLPTFRNYCHVKLRPKGCFDAALFGANPAYTL